MLIAFEGQDGAGKTALLRAAHAELSRQGVPAVVVSEFSDSPYGQRLLEAVVRDKFLRPTPDEPATVLTRALEIVADLYYLDERVIAPAIEAGYIVLKDRHIDTVFFTQVPVLAQADMKWSPTHVQAWLSVLMSELRYFPAVTVYVDAPLEVRLARIKRRQRHLAEHRVNQVTDEDLEVFVTRERIMRQLISSAPSRFLTVDNSRPLAEGVSQILELVHTRRSAAAEKGEPHHG